MMNKFTTGHTADIVLVVWSFCSHFVIWTIYTFYGIVSRYKEVVIWATYLKNSGTGI